MSAMDLLPRLPLSALARACDSFSPATQIGSGATGAVFRGRLDGVDVALKRLHVPEGASPAARRLIDRAFHAELWSLATYSSPRLVRLLCYAIDEDPASRFPFVLAFELLEGGSLADHLRGPAGEAPRAPGPPLTPLERIDIALGAAAGLAYLHGLREEAGPGGGGAAATAAPAAPALPVLHRDVKSANIGLARIGGALYAKVLDCGLARALRPPPAPGQLESLSVSGVVGTLGYMAHEVSAGEYSPRSDIYALGCVLVELLSGARVGPLTTRALEDRAIEEGEGVGVVAALAEACWPPPAAAALAALALACIHHAPKKRPGSMAEVLVALRVLRATVAPSAAAAAPLVRCPLQCEEEVPEASGLRCPTGGHFACHGCLQGYVRGMLGLAVLRRNEGRIPCYHAGQGCSHAWTIKDLQEALDKGTHVAYSEALLHMLIDGPREAAALAAAQAAAVAAAARLALGERVAAFEAKVLAGVGGAAGAAGVSVPALAAAPAQAAAAKQGQAPAPAPDFVMETPRSDMSAARVVELLRVGAADARIAEAGCRALAEIAARALGQKACASTGAVPAVVASLEAHAGVAAVAEQGCRALGWIAHGVFVKDACVSPDVVLAVVAVMKAHAGSAAVAQEGCWALARIADSVPGRDACVASGAVPAVVASLKAYARVNAAAQNGCQALANIAGSTLGQHACVASGAAPAVLVALKAHTDSIGVTQMGFHALKNIALCAPGQDSCVSSGAVPAVVAALKAAAHNKHQGVVNVVESACNALANIAGSASGRAAFAASGAVPLLAAAFSTYDWHPNARTAAHNALSALGYSDNGSRK